jgi:hypothetical protein
MRLAYLYILLVFAAAGCGTTKWSDTSRTATEQLLLSTAVDRAIDNIDFRPLADKYVFVDPQYLDCVDNKYVLSTLRQHMLAEGCVLMPEPGSADIVVEVRAGAVGTDHHDVLVGIPAISVPAGGMVGVPSIPEIPFAKTTAQKGVAKIACFAYNRETGQAVWQSGAFPIVSTAKDSWFLGTGPFQRGTIYDGTHFAGSRFLFTRKKKAPAPLRQPDIPLTAQAQFRPRPALARKASNKTSSTTPAGPGKPSGPGSSAGGAPASQTVSGSSGPSLSANSAPPGAPAGGAPAANAGMSTGLPSGQVVRLPALPEPSTSNSSTNSGGLSLLPNSWLKLK